MSSSTNIDATAISLDFNRPNFTVNLKDGRCLQIPLAWFPRLQQATLQQLKNYQLMGDGQGVHWPDLDEDLSVAGLLVGKVSN